MWFTLNVVISGFLSNCSTIFLTKTISCSVPVTINSFVAGLVAAMKPFDIPGFTAPLPFGLKILLFKKLEIATADTYLTGIIVKLLFLSAKFIAESAEETTNVLALIS